MSEGITLDCAVMWRFIATRGGWWSILRLTREWSPTFSLQQVEETLVTLWRGGFLAVEFTQRDGSVYAYTIGCTPLPVEQFPEMPTDEFTVAQPPRPDLMSSNYEAPRPNYRDGAMDFAACPSLHQGQRFAFKGIADA